MNMLAEEKVYTTSIYLMQLCHEFGVFQSEADQCDVTDDLIDSGLIDSMGLMYIQEIIQEKFGLEVGTELFIAELRNIHSIATYLIEQSANEELDKNRSIN